MDNQNTNEAISSQVKLNVPLILTPQPINSIIFIILGAFITIPVLTILQRGSSTYLPVLILVGFIWVSVGGMILWIVNQKIIISSDKLLYFVNFSHKELLLQDITKVELIEVNTPKRGKAYLLNIFTNASNPFPIIPKPFGLKALSMMLSMIHEVNPHVSFNDLAQQMALGTFRP